MFSDLILDFWEGDTPVDFTIPFMECNPSAVAEIFKRPSFKALEMPPAPPPEEPTPFTAEEKNWVIEAAEAKTNNAPIPTPPPTPAAQAALERHLARFNFAVPGSQDQWQSYIMYKYFELTLDPDPKISKPALDALAKTNIVGLSNEKLEVNISAVSSEELEQTLHKKLSQIIDKAKTTRDEAIIDGEWSESA